TDGTMTALRFTEHGRSAKDSHAGAAWMGVSLYKAAEGLLAECWVEQDHYGRRHQLKTQEADPVSPIALDAWSGHEPVSDEERKIGQEALADWVTELDSWPPAGAKIDSGSASVFQPLLE